MEKLDISNIPKFSTPEEELSYLRSRVYEKTAQNPENKIEQHSAVSKTLEQYSAIPNTSVLDKKMQLSPTKVEEIVLDLAPEEHDAKIEELLGILQTKGIHSALAVVEKLNDYHVEDDFHRFLVQYIKHGPAALSLKERDPLFKALHMTLFEIALPKADKEDKEKSVKEFVASMEQFYSGMMANDYFTLEIANANHSEEVIFFASVPDGKKALFEKQFLALFTHAKIREVPDDYNIFNENGATAISYAVSGKSPVFPIKTYEEFEYDPLNVVLNSFSKLKKVGEGASIQLVFQPAGDHYIKIYKEALGKLQKGVKTKEALNVADGLGEEIWKEAKGLLSGVFAGDKKKKEEEKNETPKIDQDAIDQLTKKISAPIARVNIRIVASGNNQNEAQDILRDIESSFNQFENTRGNKLDFKLAKGNVASEMLHDFAFRIYDDKHSLPLNIHEISTFMHVQTTGIESAPQLKNAKAGSSSAPVGMPAAGTLLGVNRHRNAETPIYMSAEDRLRHFYCIGQTGTGKSTLLKNMIVQDILQGSGVCMIDPHGIDILDILAAVPKERYDDVIYFDPSYTERPMALNMLEYDINHPEQKTFVVNEMLSIFNKLFDMKVAGGPMFEQFFRNSVMLVMEDPDTGSTLLDVSKVLANKAFREMKLTHCKNPVVVQFWKEVADKAGGEASLANIVPYITSTFDVFLSNDVMRPIISQQKSSFNFREVMDGKKILLVNLSKGRLGDINANLIGLILVGKILMSALSRVDSVGKEIPPFYLYIDEFQNVTTDSIATIFSEARKYKLSLTVAHQFISQLDEKIRDSVFGNVGSIAAFRVGAEDAEVLVKQFEPVFTAQDIINLDNRNAYVRMLVNGRPVTPFNIETLPPPSVTKDHVEHLKELSYLKFGRDSRDIESDIAQKYTQKPV